MKKDLIASNFPRLQNLVFVHAHCSEVKLKSNRGYVRKINRIQRLDPLHYSHEMYIFNLVEESAIIFVYNHLVFKSNFNHIINDVVLKLATAEQLHSSTVSSFIRNHFIRVW